MIRRIKACLNGSRRADDHPAVPITPDQLARAAAAAVAAGAEAVHLHPRDGAGAESLRPEHIGTAVAAVRDRCPHTPIGVSTGLWITGGDTDQRQAEVARWAGLPPSRRPDFASVNLSEDGFSPLAATLRDAGILVEAGVWSVEDATALTGVPVGRVLIEIIGTPGAGAVSAADRIVARLDQLGLTAPRLLHGENDACWPLVRHAARLGLATRIGLEDTLVTEDGELAAGNAELVRRAVRIWAQGQRNVR